MRVMAYPRYAALGASSRIRWLQFLPELRRLGLDIDVSPLLDDEYLRRKYAGRPTPVAIARAYAGRAAVVLARRDSADVVWIEKELWPWAPAWLERLAWGRRPVVLDYDDAVFHSYDLHRSGVARALFGGKIDRLMRAAALVVAGNDYLAQRARQAGAPRVEVLPTVVDLQRYAVAARPSEVDGPLRIGWIGSPATIDYMRLLADPLAALATQRRIVLRLIGATLDLPGVPTEHVPWTEAGEVQAIAELDVGVMPLPDSPWERGKCGYKLVQYLACGVPVVASPVGVNTKIVQPGQNGFLAATDAEWVQALTCLADDAALRRRLGAQGRALVESRYSLQVAAPTLAAWLQELGARR